MNKADAARQVAQDAVETKIESILQKFLTSVAKMEEEYGSEAIQAELIRLFPDLDLEKEIAAYESDIATLNESQQVELLQEYTTLLRLIPGAFRVGARGLSAVGGLAKGLWSRLKGLVSRGGKGAKGAKGKGKGPAGAGAAKGGKGKKDGLWGAMTGFAGASAAEIASKNWDQDVKIDDVNPDTPPLQVSSVAIEELMKDTLEAIQNLTAAIDGTKKDLGGRLDAIDQNQDDLIGLETGLSGEQVASQQGVQGGVNLRALKGGGETDDKKIKDLEKRIKGDPKDRPSFEERPA